MSVPRGSFVGLSVVAALVAAGSAYLLRPSEPIWVRLLEERFGREVLMFDEPTFNTPWRGAGGSLTRAAWIKWRDGDVDFIGLPAHEIEDPHRVIERAELLSQSEWWDWCKQEVAPEADGWSLPHEHPGDTLTVHPNQVALAGNSAHSLPDFEPSCEFRYTPRGWELRKVETVPRTAG